MSSTKSNESSSRLKLKSIMSELESLRISQEEQKRELEALRQEKVRLEKQRYLSPGRLEKEIN